MLEPFGTKLLTIQPPTGWRRPGEDEPPQPVARRGRAPRGRPRRHRRGQGSRGIVLAVGLVLLAVCGLCPPTAGAQGGGSAASAAPAGGGDTAVAEGSPGAGPDSSTVAEAPAVRLESNISHSSAPEIPPENEIRIAGHTIDAREREAGKERPPKWVQPAQRGNSAATLDIRPRDPVPYLVTLWSASMQGPRQQVTQLGGVIAAADAAAATFLVFMEPAVKAKVAKLDEVRFVKPWLVEDRLSEALTRKLAKLLPAAPAQPIQILVRLFPGQLPDAVMSTVKDADRPVGKDAVISGVEPKGPNPRGWTLRLSAAASTVLRIAALPSVWQIDLDLPAAVHNDHAIKIVRASEVQITHHLTGEGQVIGHADTGIDTGANDDTLHPDLRGRIAVAKARGRPPTGSGSPGDWSDLSGHGTHTAASIVGTGAASGGIYRGVAPGATLVHQSLANAKGTLVPPSDLGELYDQAYEAGARIHCDSWGFVSEDGGAGYGRGQDLDIWAWNGGKPRDMLIVCSAGNDGPANRTITQPATAKNCLTVGASTTDRNGLGDAAEIFEKSARGPAGERIKPDLVAPGAWIASARTQAEKTVWHASPDQPDGWVAPPPFSWSPDRGRSGSHSWHYAREAGSSQTDRLESPPFSLPMVGRPLVLEVALAGRIGDGYSVLAQISAGGGGWVPLERVQSVSDEWATQTFKIADGYQGKDDLRVGIEISATAPEAGGIDLFLDGFRITTLETWGYLADAGLIDHGDPRDGLYDFDGGTSMAAPMVCGGAALVRQFFEQQFHVSPSAELVKATLINGARPLGTRSVPNFDEGWGRLDVESAIYPGAGKKLLFEDGTALSEKETDSTQITVTDPAELRLTLVWCDPPGDGLTAILGLVLYDPDGQAYFPPGASADLPDRRNNVQRIVVETAEPGAWRAEVTARTIAGSPPVPQPFALVISGAVQATPAGREAGDPSAPEAPGASTSGAAITHLAAAGAATGSGYGEP
jgi:hypothetical protein